MRPALATKQEQYDALTYQSGEDPADSRVDIPMNPVLFHLSA
jgi:hypothetical protein